MFISILPAMAISDINDHWANDAIQRWSDFGVVRGYDDGTFRPDNHITRAEFATIINRVLRSDATSDATFPDVAPNAWYASEIRQAHATGFMRGDADGTMRPNDNVTREEAAVMLGRAFNVAENSGNENPFADADEISGWASYLVDGMRAAGYITGFYDDTFRPRNYITRAETVVLIDRIALEFYLENNQHPTALPPPIGGGSILPPNNNSGGGNQGGGSSNPPFPGFPPVTPPPPDVLVFEIPREIRVSSQNHLYLIDIIQLSDNTIVTSEVLQYNDEDANAHMHINGTIDEIGRQILLQTWWDNIESGREFTIEFTATRRNQTLTRQMTVIIENDEWNWENMVQVYTPITLPDITGEYWFDHTVWFRDINTGQIFGGGGGWTMLPVGEFEVIAGGAIINPNSFMSFDEIDGITGYEESFYDIDSLSSGAGSAPMPPPSSPSPPPSRPFIIPEHNFDLIPSTTPQNVIITQEDVDNYHENWDYEWVPKELPSITLVHRAQRTFSLLGTIIAPYGVTGTAYVTLRSRLHAAWGEPLYTRTIEVPINGIHTQYSFGNVPIGVYDIIVDLNRTEIAQITTVLNQNRAGQNITLTASDRELGRVAGTITIDRTVDWDMSVWVNIFRGYSNFCPESGAGNSWSVSYWGDGFIIPAGQTSVDFLSSRLPTGEYYIQVSIANTLTDYIIDTVQITNYTVQKDFNFTVGQRITGHVANWQRFAEPWMSGNNQNRVIVRLVHPYTLTSRSMMIAPFPRPPTGGGLWPWPSPSGNFGFHGLESGTYEVSVVLERWGSGSFQTIVLTREEIIINDADISDVNFDLTDVNLSYEIYRIEFEGIELSQDPNNPTVLSFPNTMQIVGNTIFAHRLVSIYRYINGVHQGILGDRFPNDSTINFPTWWGNDDPISFQLVVRDFDGTFLAESLTYYVVVED